MTCPIRLYCTLSWVDAHPELIGQAQAHARISGDRIGDEIGVLTAVSELAILDTFDKVDEVGGESDPADSAPVRDEFA